MAGDADAYESEQLMREGFILCARCESRVTTSSRAYGGMLRVVCINSECEESEALAFA